MEAVYVGRCICLVFAKRPLAGGIMKILQVISSIYFEQSGYVFFFACKR